MGHIIFIAPDYAKATAKIQKSFLDLRPRMRAFDIRYGLLHHAHLLITSKNKHLEFTASAADVESGVGMAAGDRAPANSSKRWSELFKDYSKRDFQPPSECRCQRFLKRHDSTEDLSTQEKDLRLPIK